MIIYDFRCTKCQKKEEVVLPSIQEYKNLKVPICCDQPMVRDYSDFNIPYSVGRRNG